MLYRRPLFALLALLLAVMALVSGCGGSSTSRPEWTDSESSGDSATIDHFDSAELTAQAQGVFPPCQPAQAGEGVGRDSASPCVPLPCVEKNGKDGEWYVTLRVASFGISPYEPHNEVLKGDSAKDRAILDEDAKDSDYWLHVGVTNADDFDPETSLACSADLDLSP